MKKQTLLQECLLSAAAIAVPGLCLAAEHSPLQPVTSESSLKAVPDTASKPTIQRAQFQHSLSQQAEAVSQAPSSTITLVQHDTSSKKKGEPRKPGFFKRLFAKRSSSNSDSKTVATQISPGQPGTPIPKPPAIDFTMPGQTPKANSGVPSRTASFSGTLPTYQAADSKDSTRAAVPAQQPQIQAASLPSMHSPVRSSASHDGFISPFVSEEVPQDTDALLDLDSLIQGHQQGTTGLQDAAETEPAVAEQWIPKANDPMRVIAAKKKPQTETVQPEGPFTGYQLPSDDEVLGLPEAVPEITVESAPETFPEPLPEVIVPEAKAEAATVFQVPLLEEPAMSLPPVATKPAEEELSVPEAAEVFTKPILIDPVEPQQAESFRPTENRRQEPATPSFVEEPGERTPKRNPMDSRAQREQQRYRIMARTGKAGFKGFCPVALRNDRELIDSREQYKAKFGLQTYYFSSPEAKSAFEADPVRYAPAGGGSDVVLLVNTGEETPGSLDFCLWYRDRLYMFRSRETQAMFSKDTRKYADQY